LPDGGIVHVLGAEPRVDENSSHCSRLAPPTRSDAGSAAGTTHVVSETLDQQLDLIAIQLAFRKSRLAKLARD
jgi:hypothetical protein